MLEAKFEEKGGSSHYFSSYRLLSPSFGSTRNNRMKTGISSKSSKFHSPSNESIKQKSL